MTTTLTRTLIVAAGVFAPGHLGELTRYLPFELVDDVLAQTCCVAERQRRPGAAAPRAAAVREIRISQRRAAQVAGGGDRLISPAGAGH
ncbi:MAG TPA: hypothetical protein VF003_08890 [Pseudonocardiaceae bacterium]